MAPGATIVTVAVLLLGGCLSVPVAETDAMAKATDAVASASDVLIGQLNVAEKNILQAGQGDNRPHQVRGC